MLKLGGEDRNYSELITETAMLRKQLVRAIANSPVSITNIDEDGFSTRIAKGGVIQNQIENENSYGN